MKRTQTKQIHVGPVAIGGGARVTIQSMTNTETRAVHVQHAHLGRARDHRADCPAA